jgi:glyoxylase-like metal-dependent hydrolase (beta-lactamase superfamily II)
VAPNPGPKTLTGTNTYIVGTSESFVVDPGPADTAYISALAEFVRPSKPAGIILTHGHPDHAGGADALQRALDVPIYGSALVQELAGSPFRQFRPLRPGQHMALVGVAVTCLATPGHSYDHYCFLLEPGRILLSGDTILGEGTTLIAAPEGDMEQYMATLESLKRLAPSTIAPGHGPIVTDPQAKLEEYIRHRRDREAALLEAMGDHNGASLDDLLAAVYPEAAGHEIARLARLSVQSQLVKLKKDGFVREERERFYRVRNVAV